MDLICLDNPKFPKRTKFPSWMTDWKSPWKSPEVQGLTLRNNRGFNAGYRACGGSSQFLKVSEDCLVLIVQRFSFDTIRQLSHQCRDRDRYGNESPLLAYPVLESIDELLPQNNPYGPLDGVYEAVWRALVRDQILGSGRKEVADYALCFPSLYSKKSKALIDRRSYSVRNSVAIARYFMGHGRALHE